MPLQRTLLIEHFEMYKSDAPRPQPIQCWRSKQDEMLSDFCFHSTRGCAHAKFNIERLGEGAAANQDSKYQESIDHKAFDFKFHVRYPLCVVIVLEKNFHL